MSTTYAGRKEYMRKYQREWIAERRRSYFADKCCARCGSTEKLELDHIDPSQKEASHIWSWREERRLAELTKCQVLCNGCHMAKTLSQRPKTDHGRGQMYQRHHCRCDWCRGPCTGSAGSGRLSVQQAILHKKGRGGGRQRGRDSRLRSSTMDAGALDCGVPHRGGLRCPVCTVRCEWDSRAEMSVHPSIGVTHA